MKKGPTLVNESPQFSGIGLGGVNALMASLTYTGSGTAIYINKGRFNHIHDLYLLKSGARGASIGILAAGSAISLQTAHVHTERMTIDGFFKGWEAGNAATNSAADECLFTKVSFTNNTYGFYANSNFNDIKYHFSQCVFALNDYGAYTATGSSLSFTGCNGGSNTITDITNLIGGDSLTIEGWDGEITRQFLLLGNGASAKLSGIVLRGPTLSRNDSNVSTENAIIDLGGGKLYINTLFHGANNKSTGATGAHLFRLRGGSLVAKNIFTTDDHPVYVNPINSEDDGSFYSVENVTIIDNMTNGGLYNIMCESGVIIWPNRVPYKSCESFMGNGIQKSVQLDLALVRSISSTLTQSRNLRGQYTFVGGDAGVKAITFKRSVADGVMALGGGFNLSSATINFSVWDIGKKTYVSKAGPNPRADISGGTPDVSAIASVTLNISGVITAIDLVNICDATGVQGPPANLPCTGFGYDSVPTVNIVDPYSFGSGAIITANVVGGKVTSFTLTNGGTNYGYLVSPITLFSNSTSVRTAALAFTATTTSTIIIGENEPDVNYVVVITGNANETFKVTTKATTGFTVTSSNVASTATIDWILMR